MIGGANEQPAPAPTPSCAKRRRSLALTNFGARKGCKTVADEPASSGSGTNTATCTQQSDEAVNSTSQMSNADAHRVLKQGKTKKKGADELYDKKLYYL